MAGKIIGSNGYLPVADFAGYAFKAAINYDHCPFTQP